MPVDVILILITLATAVIGTLSTPPRWVKGVIVSLAILTSGATIIKSYIDDEDKDFVKTALVNSLSLSDTQAFSLLSRIADNILLDDNCNWLDAYRIPSDGRHFLL
jgi:hypothetical protein